MTPERWRQIEELYHAALEHSPDERTAFLHQACAGDEEMRREIASLLASHDQASSFIEAPPDDVVAGMMAEEQIRSMIGRTFGHYRINALLGMGGMGEVYLAEDEQLGRKAAIKLLPQQFMLDRERVQRFKQEARAVSALNHPNIVTIYEIGQAEGLHFIATEFIDGRTLRRMIAAGETKIPVAIEIAAQIASALAAAHKAGIAHRDIKPENIMVRRDGYVKVLDFGLAKLIELPSAMQTTIGDGETITEEQVRTNTGNVIGTPRYMSPEQICGQEIDGRSDIFNLGLLLYEMITGHGPFKGNTPFEIVAEILVRAAPLLKRYLREVPDEIERIVGKALTKDREQRYQTAEDLLVDLRNLRLELEIESKIRGGGQTNVAAPPPLSAPSQPASHPTPSSQSNLREKLEPVGGAVPLDSRFYIVRRTDDEFQAAIARQDSIVLVKGARQVGKTSLLARGLQRARDSGARVVLTDFQELTADNFESVGNLALTLAELFADQLDLEVAPGERWKSHLSPSINLDRYLRREVFARVTSPIVWGLDEVDRLFTYDFGGEVFGLFRSWHNKRALDPTGPWRRLTLAIAYATEAHLFITDLNQSPFNVGTRLSLDDFTFEQLSELNRRYGSPLGEGVETARFHRLVGGHPYLVRRGLHEMVARGQNLATLESGADQDEGPFGDHLRRLLLSLMQDAELCEVVRNVLHGQPCPDPESFYRLRSAGLMTGNSATDVRPRCQLYASYLEKRLI